jgi:hypothetical protein
VDDQTSQFLDAFTSIEKHLRKTVHANTHVTFLCYSGRLDDGLTRESTGWLTTRPGTPARPHHGLPGGLKPESCTLDS